MGYSRRRRNNRGSNLWDTVEGEETTEAATCGSVKGEETTTEAATCGSVKGEETTTEAATCGIQ